MIAIIARVLPYLRRGFRVFVYGAIPVIATWVIDSDPVMLEAGIRVAISASLLAILDKRRMKG